MKSIRTKILCMNFAIIFTVIFAIGGMGIYTADVLLKKESEMALHLMCDAKKEELNAMFRCVEHSVKIVTSQALEELPQDITDGMDDAYTEHMLKLFANISKDTRGAISYYLRYNPEISDAVSGFFWSKESGETEFTKYPCTDLLAYEQSDVEHVGWYYIPVLEGKAMWLEPYQNRNNNIFMCSYVSPYYLDEQLIGVVGMDVDIAGIMDIINDSNVYSSGYGYLIDNENRIVYHKDFVSGEEKPATSDEQLEYEVVLNNGLTLVMNVNQDEVYILRNSLVQSILLCALVSVFISAIASILVTNRIIHPLTALTNAVKGLKNGNYNPELDVKSEDEVGILARNFVSASNYIKEQTEYINSLAYKDSLTGIWNATAYAEAVSVLQRKMQDSAFQFAVVIFDVNNLKQMNDNYGHEAGNVLLKGAVGLMTDVFSSHSLYRIGGDEFLVILEGEAFEQREELFKRFDEKMKQTFCEVRGEVFSVAIAKGMAIREKSVNETYAQIFKRADELMYENKANMKKR